MTDIDSGVRDSRGEWKPDVLPEPSPLFTRPWKPLKVFKYLFGWVGYFWPYNALFAVVAIISWVYFTPDLSRAVTFRIGWMAEIYLRNVVLVSVLAGGLHLRLYIAKAQGKKFKYNNNWLAKNNRKFLFRNQTADNVFWALVSGCAVWTIYESLTLWMYANGRLPYISFSEHPFYFVFLMIAVTFIREAHFYWIHRFSHWKPILKMSHYLHHKNINFGPWSGLSMHPIEHLLYFSGVFIHWIIPSSPLHAIFHLTHAGLSPFPGHSGFDKLVGKNTNKGIAVGAYSHYLHHRYFTVNFGVEAVPFDKWFGSYHDGSPEAHAAMMERRKKKVK